ncbi:MAG: sugar ABC transporter permease [Lachnospiraceae bacterium]|nr:sugar ABC transporter permease [Lachnospiraceae bacterium]
MVPSLLGVTVFVLFPFADVVCRSFSSALGGRFTGLSNFRTVLCNQAFWLAVKNTVCFTAVCLPILIGTGLLIAVGLGRMKYARLLKPLFLFPMAMPAATVVLIWHLVFARLGLLNGLADGLFARLPAVVSEALGLKGGPVRIAYMDTALSFWVLVFSYVWKNLGYTIVLWMAGIAGIPASVTEAARIDGAGERQVFRYVILPNLKSSLYTITVLSLLNSFKVFREAYLVAGAYPQENIYLLQHLFNNWFVNMELDKMAAGAVLAAAALLVLILGLPGLLEE